MRLNYIKKLTPIWFVPLVASPLVACQSKAELPPVVPVNQPTPVVEKSDEKVKNYSLVSPEHPIIVGRPNTVTLEIRSQNGLKINHEFPWKVKFKSQSKLDVSEQELTKNQIEMGEKRVRMTIDVTPHDAGTFDLDGVGTFSVCSLKLCDIRRNEPLRFTLVAEPEA